MEKILIIDDAFLMLRALKDILDKDYIVFTLQDGKKTVEMTKKIMPSLILLDIVMPKVSGFDVIQQLKADPVLAEIPVIFLTGLTDESNEEKGFQLGAVDYIIKPFRASIVRARVNTQVKLFLSKSQLTKEQKYNQIIFGLTDDALFDYDILEKRIKYSKNFAERFYIPEVLENYPQSIIETGIISENFAEIFLGFVSDINQGVASGNNSEIQLKLPTGELVWYSLHYDILYNTMGLPSNAVGKMTDITKQKERMNELLVRAELDPLTKLFNKEESRIRIEKSLAESSLDEKFAMIILDIDNFKGVNDTLGHQFGDAVLSDIAGKIKGLFRDSDIVGRLGGDEFIVFLRRIPNETIVHDKARALCDEFRNTFTGEKNDYKISGSIGIALSPLHGKSFKALYHHADLALYASKHKGKDCYTVYFDELSEHTQNTTPAPDANRFVTNYFAGDMIYNIFQMLYETTDLHTTINMILGILGKRFHADRCVIFEQSEDGHTIRNTYEWCAKRINSQMHSLQAIPTEKLLPMFSSFNEDGIFWCTDITQLDEFTSELLARKSVKSILRSAIYAERELKGFVGFEDCNDHRIWSDEEIATLSYISRILSIFIFKNQPDNESQLQLA